MDRLPEVTAKLLDKVADAHEGGEATYWISSGHYEALADGVDRRGLHFRAARAYNRGKMMVNAVRLKVSELTGGQMEMGFRLRGE